MATTLLTGCIGMDPVKGVLQVHVDSKHPEWLAHEQVQAIRDIGVAQATPIYGFPANGGEGFQVAPDGTTCYRGFTPGPSNP